MHGHHHGGGYHSHRGGFPFFPFFFPLGLIFVGIILFTVLKFLWPLLLVGLVVAFFSGAFRGRRHGRWGRGWGHHGRPHGQWGHGGWGHGWHGDWEKHKRDWDKRKNDGDDEKHKNDDDVTVYV